METCYLPARERALLLVFSRFIGGRVELGDVFLDVESVLKQSAFGVFYGDIKWHAYCAIC